ncbi:hypothetical protein PHISCL_08153 [Aspergillus sclerotialis]|uniref:Uncharacterized protein n=1 Tax=Aspergillus sclerotialis TaxID=2070753 RepID=A0A3A2ZQZ5_9EURO|nr:hypothetical protein PHISCL_08153 [Aspergillus sclerotialis]
MYEVFITLNSGLRLLCPMVTREIFGMSRLNSYLLVLSILLTLGITDLTSSTEKFLPNGVDHDCYPALADSPLPSYISNLSDPTHYRDYRGSYFGGMGFYNLTFQTPKSGKFGPKCPITVTSMRILAAAWVGPQIPNTTAVSNPFILGFNGLLTEEPERGIYRPIKPCDSLQGLLFPIHLYTTYIFRVSFEALPNLGPAPDQIKDAASLNV